MLYNTSGSSITLLILWIEPINDIYIPANYASAISQMKENRVTENTFLNTLLMI